MNIPNKDEVYPNENIKTIAYIKNVIKNPNIEIGDYTYYSSENPETFEKQITHHYDFIGDKLIIGKFCSIASGVEFIMNGANHAMKGISTYPFYIMGKDWGNIIPNADIAAYKGDTVIGNDVWIGQNSTILPGVKIGNGVIIGANSTVASDVPDYAIVVGNPAKIIKFRFNKDIIAKLLELEWWNEDINWISENINSLSNERLKEEKLNVILGKLNSNTKN